MRSQAIRARLRAGCALLLLAAVAGACGGRYEEFVAPTSLLRVDLPAGATPAVLSEVRAIAGVAHVTGFSVVDARATAGAASSALKLAIVDPAELAPIAGSSTPGLQTGTMLVAPASLQSLGLAGGGTVKLRANGVAHSIAVAPLTDELAITGASAIVARERVSWIAAGRPTMIVVGVSSDADPTATANELAARLGSRVGVAPRTPSFLAGRAASRLFGSFSYLVNADGTIEQDPRWVARYIVRARVPIFGVVTCHRMMVRQLASALAEVKRLGLASAIDTTQYGGCYVARKILWDPANPVSMHAWGLAIDFNVSTNGYGERPQMHPRIVEVFERWGFRWGGRWRTPDGMHFELAALVRR